MRTSTSTRQDPTPRPLRADARRNRDRLLKAAATAFAAQGTDASLDDIARRAGVGPGTLYRHFPTREDLIEALIHSGVEDLVAQSEQLLDAEDPLAALRTWLLALLRHASAYRGLAESLEDAKGGQGRLAAACHAQEAAASALFTRARKHGHVRPQVTLEDVLHLVSGIAWVAQRQPPGHGERLLTLVLDGLARDP
jgi:AcrR family transcriptional regulator